MSEHPKEFWDAVDLLNTILTGSRPGKLTNENDEAASHPAFGELSPSDSEDTECENRALDNNADREDVPRDISRYASVADFRS